MIGDLVRPYLGPTEVVGKMHRTLEFSIDLDLMGWVLIGPDGESWLGDDPVAMAEAAAAAARSRHPFDEVSQPTEAQ